MVWGGSETDSQFAIRRRTSGTWNAWVKFAKSNHTHSSYASSSHTHPYLPLAGGVTTDVVTQELGGVAWSHNEATHRPVSKKLISEVAHTGTTGLNIQDVYGEADVTGIMNSVTFTYLAAWEVVEAEGGRLPTLAELQDEVGAGSGQSYDAEVLWTCTPAGPHHVWAFIGRISSYPDSVPIRVDITNDANVYRTRCFWDVSRKGKQANYNHSGVLDADTVDGFSVAKSVPSNAVFTDNNTTYSNFSGTTAGLVPTSTSTDDTKFLRADGTWVVPTDTTVADTQDLSITGHTISLTNGGSVTVPDNNTTYSVGDNGLTQKNFTTTLKTKLDGIATSANNYSLPSSVIHQTELSSSTSSTSTTVAANSAAVKTAYDKGNHSHPYASTSHTHTRISYDANSYIEAQDTRTRIQTNNGYLQIGPMNSSWCHLQTDMPRFYLNKKLEVDGSIGVYGKDASVIDTNGKIKASSIISVPASWTTDTVYTLPASVVHDTEKGALHATDALRISGHTVSLYKGDGTSESVTIPDNNTDTWRSISDSTSSNSTTVSASSKAVKTAYDKGNHSHPYLGSTAKAADSEKLDGIDSSGFARFYNNAVLNSSTTTASFLSELETDYGCFGNKAVSIKVQWNYSGSSDLVTGDSIVGTIELAGCLIETWGGTYKHVRVTRPTTGTGGERVCVYNDQSSGYSPSWRMIWTSDTDGAGSGLDADKLDGKQGSEYSLAHTHPYLPLTGGTMSGDITMGSGDNIHRSTHSSGYLVGSYNNVGDNSAKTNPIYTIGSNYQPSDTSLSNMYGIGYSHPNAGGTINTVLDGWGMYVSADGDARIGLGGSDGKIIATGAIRSNHSFMVDGTTVIETDAKIDANKIKSVPASWTTDTVYTHPITAGNKHVPSGGSSGKYLKYSASGTAAWADAPAGTPGPAGPAGPIGASYVLNGTVLTITA